MERMLITRSEENRRLRSDKLDRPRLVPNNDCGDASGSSLRPVDPAPARRDVRKVYYEITPETFLSVNMAGLIASDVTTISYHTNQHRDVCTRPRIQLEGTTDLVARERRWP